MKALPAKTVRIVAALVALGAFVAGCAPMPPAATVQTVREPAAHAVATPVTEDMLVGAAWQLQDLPGMATLRLPVPSIQFLGLQQVQGSDGCNRFAAKVSVAAQTVRFSDLRATLMACMPTAPGQEDRFFLALERTHSIRVQDGRLHLLDQSGKLLAVFRR